ncbi:hypothetical protein [Natronorubrum daqingense]|uniref:Uncharacterized protein n=1 Tax=Natronorubrum daqingense TaxID=588898 RepID=A0A1N7F6G5_9EURY|nr:hypothetical protein [Natronorubrum daqingense]APX97569.1 hypothetical protein BB347_13660 [Natronorubrum daqingense]SIR95931.1 hypothetical protein SAMN05421809_3050 [Natronorubrum daqingense]
MSRPTVFPSITPSDSVSYYSSDELETWDYQVLRKVATKVPTDEISGNDMKGDIAFFLAHNYTAGEIDQFRKRVE